MSDRTQDGAGAFLDLLAYVGDLSDSTCTDLDELGSDCDGRDYMAMCQMIEHSLRVNLGHADAMHREGYIRALTALLCLVADGCGPSVGWDPLQMTAPAFKAPTAAAAAIARAAAT